MEPLPCRHLRTKKMFTVAVPADVLREKDEGSPCHFWCNLTQSIVGADDRPADKTTCNPSRTCFEE